MNFVNWVNDTDNGPLNFFAVSANNKTFYTSSDLHESLIFGIMLDVINTEADKGTVDEHSWRLGAVNDHDNILEASQAPGWEDGFIDQTDHIEVQIANSNNLFPGEHGYVKEYGPKRPGMA